MTAIRRAGAADAGRLAPLYADFFAEDGIPLPPDLAANLAAMIADPRAAVWCLDAPEDAAPPIGFASATLSRGAEFGLSAEIEDLYVVPAHRGHGHARALFETALDWCRALGAAEIAVVVTDIAEADQGLAAFYARFGFRDAGRRILLAKG